MLSKRRYNCQHVIPLEHVKVEDIEEFEDDNESDSKHGFLIKSRHKSFVVYTVNEKEKKDWVTHISRCVDILLKSKYGKNEVYYDLLNLDGRRPLSDDQHAAVWIPDCEATKCMHCNTTNFTVLNRRVRTIESICL